MSIFGKKISGHGIPEGDSQKPHADVPQMDKFAFQTPSTVAPRSPSMEPPTVQKAMPPSMTQAPGITQAPSMNSLPGMTQAPGMGAPNQTMPPGMRNPGITMSQAAPMPEAAKSPYSIDDVIRLMRELPDSKKEMVVVIVQKTLLSAKIDVSAIIDDAASKVDKLMRSSDRLVSEIRELEEAIILKKGEVDRLNKELEETSSVKQIFEVTYGRHVKGE